MAGNGISYPANGVSFVPGTTIPSNGAVVTDGQTNTLTKADGTGNLGTVTLDVSGGSVSWAALAGNLGVVTNNVSVNINQYDNSGSVAAAVGVLANNATFTLANATTRIAINAEPINVKNSGGTKTISSTMGIDQGAFTGVTLPTTAALMTTGDAISIQIQSGASSVGGTFNYDTQAPRARLPAGASFVSNGIGIQVPVTGTYTNTITPQVNASGVITGFTLS